VKWYSIPLLQLELYLQRRQKKKAAIKKTSSQTFIDKAAHCNSFNLHYSETLLDEEYLISILACREKKDVSFEAIGEECVSYPKISMFT
jgi:hypothetical protein